MIGYLFYYGNDYDIDQNQKLILFSLNNVLRSSMLNRILMVVETTELTLGGEFSYRFCN